MPAFGRMHRVTAVVPLAALSAAWTASMVGVGTQSASADSDDTGVLPDGTTIPAQAVEAPASVGKPVTRISSVADVSASGIPEAALAAYQRAEAVINKADAGCNITWQLIAAIGRVESDHGRYGGNALTSDGVARPGIYGIALDGSDNTQRITDTDGGQYDKDTRFDRAVGPMQFIPSTWSVVGVDGDNDGTRNPQDIDDAALATAVYLCSGDDDLSTEAGQRSSVFRYNHSNDYVDLVLEIMQAYLDGDFSEVPNGFSTSGNLVPDTSPNNGGGKGNGGRDGAGGGKDGGGRDGGSNGGDSNGNGGGNGGSGGGNTPTPTPTSTPTPTPTPTQAPNTPSAPVPTNEPTQVPTQTPTLPVPTQTPTATLPPAPVPTVPAPLTPLQAQTQCTAAGVLDNPLTPNNELDECAQRVLQGGTP